MSDKIKTFKDLDAWKEGHKVVLMVYKLTNTFPPEELYGLVSQMRRCVVSITSNIAEGFGRNSQKEKVQFYSISRGSITELQNQLLIAHDVGYITFELYAKVDSDLIRVQKITGGLMKYAQGITFNTAKKIVADT